MKKYLVCVDVSAVAYAEIEADSLEDAERQAEKLWPQDVEVDTIVRIDGVVWIEEQEDR